MDLPFDTSKTDAQLAEVRGREEEDVVRILSEKYGMHYVDLALHEIDTEALRAVPEEDAHKAEAAVFARANKTLSLAVHNPNNRALPGLLHDLENRGYAVKQFLVSHKSLEKALDRYGDLSYATESKPGTFEVKGDTLARLTDETRSRTRLRQALDAMVAEKALDRVSRIFEIVLAGAFALGASDIHVEPEEEKARLRLRLDGVLTDAYFFDPKTYHLLNSRVKLLSGVKLNVSDRAQDGRFTVSKGDRPVELRASFIPGAYGESIVLRILDPEATKTSFKDLGIPPKLLARLEKEIRKPNGMLLTTGPTGSGKTTTLYSFLRELESPDIKIITIENPIEYHLEGIVQTQVDGKNYTFSEGLKSIVRQDPDIIMVGEIRDADTADIAIQAALTGHLVFSTLHTNDAAGTFPRLADLGADPKSFGSAITVAMAQRLVRRLHPDHRKERPLEDDEKAMIRKVFEGFPDASLIPQDPQTVWEPNPANEEDTGYAGRIGLYEAIFMDDELANFLRDNPPAADIRKATMRQGFLTMAQDGIVKALAGLTSLKEVADTVGLPDA